MRAFTRRILAAAAVITARGPHSSPPRPPPGHTTSWTGAPGTPGGAYANCPSPIGASAGVIGQGGSISPCNATSETGGNGSAGSDNPTVLVVWGL